MHVVSDHKHNSAAGSWPCRPRARYVQVGEVSSGCCGWQRRHGAQVEYDLLVGADGANSVVRSELMRSNPAMQGAHPTALTGQGGCCCCA